MKCTMRLRYFLIGILVAFFPLVLAHSDDTHKRFLVASGIMEYTLSGSQVGTQTVYFDHWGLRQAKYTKSETALYGSTNILTLIDHEWIYTIDLDKRIGSKVEDVVAKELLQNTEDDGSIPLEEQILTKLGGEKNGQEEVADRPCDVWQIPALGQQACLWKGIPLKSHTKTPMEEVTHTATSIQEDAVIGEDKFAIPEGVQFIQGNINEIILSRKDLTYLIPKKTEAKYE